MTKSDLFQSHKHGFCLRIKIFAKQLSDKELVSKICKAFLQLNFKKTNNLNKVGKSYKQYLTKEVI